MMIPDKQEMDRIQKVREQIAAEGGALDPEYFHRAANIVETQMGAAKSVWASEREDVLNRFMEELKKATGDGSEKRQAGLKPSWAVDPSHKAALFSHLYKWSKGEKYDGHSGAHPLVHLAWRALAIACQESGNVPPV
jgi:hypothetical protein